MEERKTNLTEYRQEQQDKLKAAMRILNEEFPISKNENFIKSYGVKKG